MSLRFRLIGLVALALLTSLLSGGAIVLVIASQSVRTEMRSALLVAHQTIDQEVHEIKRSPDPQRDLNDLVASFAGSRHLRIRLNSEAAPLPAVASKETLPFGNVPWWFVRLIGVDPESDRVPVAIAGNTVMEIIITTDPTNEILEVWDEMNGTLIVLALFAGQTIPLIYLSIGRALRPLDRLAAAIEQVGQGDYQVRVRDRLTPELTRLRDSFNRMAAHLASADADSYRLTEQMSTLQEEERSDIARDLHDEFGPLLFAINVDIANVSRIARQQGAEDLLPRIQLIAETAHQLQRQVRGMLGRLRQTGVAEFGLTEALGGLIDFWRRRYPRIDYQLSISSSCDSFGTALDTTIYRIVQEGLSNAVRHGDPHRVAIAVHAVGDDGHDQVSVAVCDDGRGMPAESEPGYGLIGVEERVRGAGGQLKLSNALDGGFTLIATLPVANTDAPVFSQARPGIYQ